MSWRARALPCRLLNWNHRQVPIAFPCVHRGLSELNQSDGSATRTDNSLTVYGKEAGLGDEEQIGLAIDVISLVG